MQHLASVRWKDKGVVSGKSHLLTSDICKWIHVSQSIEDHWRATHSLDGELPTSGITTAKGGELSSSPRCPQMPVLVSQLLPTAVSEMLISVYIIWGEKKTTTLPFAILICKSLSWCGRYTTKISLGSAVIFEPWIMPAFVSYHRALWMSWPGLDFPVAVHWNVLFSTVACRHWHGLALAAPRRGLTHPDAH